MAGPDLNYLLKSILESGDDTKHFYFQRNLLYREWREELHDEIVRSQLTGSFSRERKVFMLGGAPANAKSSFSKSKYCNYPQTALRIDPDIIKTKLPEYDLMITQHMPEAAMIVHEESSDLAKRIRREAIKNEIDILLDGVADGSLELRRDVWKEFDDNGYYIRMDYVTLETEKSLEIAVIRGEETGRFVAPEFIKSMNKEIAILVPQLIENELFNEFYLWDTNIKDNPRLILEQKGRNLQIHEPNLYENFKNKRL
ncbi:zeta toxin family protein [Ferruginibacter albus]|uniref:zeta toxin family protein n=1 Tax=Ferruginibacter albus TaxID=2875540 RepID=UPI001CC7F3CA|nr:zeta toxin family protein [Ferruginibacter albus]UAY53200.1 zeta toxin family protein [Ferruginibacter albus]